MSSLPSAFDALSILVHCTWWMLCYSINEGYQQCDLHCAVVVILVSCFKMDTHELDELRNHKSWWMVNVWVQMHLCRWVQYQWRMYGLVFAGAACTEKYPWIQREWHCWRLYGIKDNFYVCTGVQVHEGNGWISGFSMLVLMYTYAFYACLKNIHTGTWITASETTDIQCHMYEGIQEFKLTRMIMDMKPMVFGWMWQSNEREKHMTQSKYVIWM